MNPWLKIRLETLQDSLPHPVLLAAFGILQTARIYWAYRPPALSSPLLTGFVQIHWFLWALAWALLLWLSTLNHSAKRKETFDLTSRNFFGAYLDHLIREGHSLYEHSGEENFYFGVDGWQHKAIEGIAIGLGHEAAEKFHQAMEGRYPLVKAYQDSKEAGNGEPLCRALQGHLEELEKMRIKFIPMTSDPGSGLTPTPKSPPPRETDPRYLLK